MRHTNSNGRYRYVLVGVLCARACALLQGRQQLTVAVPATSLNHSAHAQVDAFMSAPRANLQLEAPIDAGSFAEPHMSSGVAPTQRLSLGQMTSHSSAQAKSQTGPSLCQGAGCVPLASTFGTYQHHSSCTPQCTWKCETSTCDEVCEPECESPVCEVRCASPDLALCHMDCAEPQCQITCPQRMCPSTNCPSCTTACTDPMCKLACPSSQNCRNVCETPKCDWKCRAPTNCPAPKCQMFCEQPKNCMGSTHSVMPPLGLGETSVKTFVAPISLAQTFTARTSPLTLRKGPNEGSQLQKTVLVTVNSSSVAGVQSNLVEMPVRRT